MDKMLGIDFGTTNTRAFVFNNGVFTNVIDGVLPSFATIVDGECQIGKEAETAAPQYPAAAIYAVKRLLGLGYNDPRAQDWIDVCPYFLAETADGLTAVEIGDAFVAPVRIAARIFARIKNDAEKRLGAPVGEAVVAAPGRFNHVRRQALETAAQLGGFQDVVLVNALSAAGAAWFAGKSGGKIAVADFGGGSFDFSLMEYDGAELKILAADGDCFLGGEDFDQRLVASLIEKFKSGFDLDFSASSAALWGLKTAARKAREELSRTLETAIFAPDSNAQNAFLRLSRTELESLVEGLVRRALEVCETTLARANLRPDGLDAVLLLGGLENMPLVERILGDFFGEKILRPDLADELVARGAALIGATLAGEVKEPLLRDVAAFSYGIENGGDIARIAAAGTALPFRKNFALATAEDNQATLTLHVVQGDSREDATSVGYFEIGGIPPRPAGQSLIGIGFYLTPSEDLWLSATDIKSGKDLPVGRCGAMEAAVKG